MFFDFVVKASITSSFLVLFIFLIQKIFKNIVPHIRYYLWLIVIIKLLLPIDIQSGISLERFISIEPKVQEMKYIQVAAEVIETEKINQDSILEYLWFGGVLIILCYGLFLYIKLKRNLSNSREITDLKYRNILKCCMESLDIKSEVKILEVNFVESPSIIGVFKPKILLPSNLLNTISEKNIRYIFLHELTHYKYGDTFINVLLQMVRILYFFNPITFFATMKVKEECEIACDFRVLKKLGKDEFKNYGNALIDLSVSDYKREYIPLSVGMSMNKNELKRRIAMIGKNNKFGKKHFIAGFGALLMVGTIGLTTYADSKGEVRKESEAVIDNEMIGEDKTIIEESTGDVGAGVEKGEKIIEAQRGTDNTSIDSHEGEVVVYEDNKSVEGKGVDFKPFSKEETIKNIQESTQEKFVVIRKNIDTNKEEVIELNKEEILKYAQTGEFPK